MLRVMCIVFIERRNIWPEIEVMFLSLATAQHDISRKVMGFRRTLAIHSSVPNAIDRSRVR